MIQIFLLELNSISKLKGREVNITLWDVDDEALSKSEHIINKVKSELGFKGNLSIENTDSFVNYIDHIGLFDFCITNPPWGLLKPLKIINSRSSDDVVNSYKNALSAYDDYFKKEFVTSQPKSKFGRWGTNLGRAGVEVSTCLVRTGGICGFVSPSSLFNDQVSFNFRKILFEKYKIESISYFPAKLKLYRSTINPLANIYLLKSINFSLILVSSSSLVKTKSFCSQTSFNVLKSSKWLSNFNNSTPFSNPILYSLSLILNKSLDSKQVLSFSNFTL